LPNFSPNANATTHNNGRVGEQTERGTGDLAWVGHGPERYRFGDLEQVTHLGSAPGGRARHRSQSAFSAWSTILAPYRTQSSFPLSWGPSSSASLRMTLKINVMSVMVDDQAKALRFDTEVLGFVKKSEISLGEHSWLTVVSPEDPTAPRYHSNPTSTRRRGRSRRSWRMASRSRRLPSTTSLPNTSVSSLVACGSRNRRPTWDR
jgi:hypothetical protein